MAAETSKPFPFFAISEVLQDLAFRVWNPDQGYSGIKNKGIQGAYHDIS
jgi:hypothetical protein